MGLGQVGRAGQKGDNLEEDADSHEQGQQGGSEHPVPGGVQEETRLGEGRRPQEVAWTCVSEGPLDGAGFWWRMGTL